MSLQEAQSDEGSAPSRTGDGQGQRVSDGILRFWGLGAGLAGGQGRVHTGPARSHACAKRVEHPSVKFLIRLHSR